MEQARYNSLFSFIWNIATYVLDIVEKTHLRLVIDDLTERLGSIIEKFTSDHINLSNKPFLDDEDNKQLHKIDQYVADLQREIDYLEEFKQRLISDAVTRQLYVTKQ